MRRAGSNLQAVWRYHRHMVILHGILPIKLSRRDEALTLARALSDATQAEGGCVSHEFYVGLRDPNKLILLQEWEDMRAFAKHFDTEHMRVFMAALPELLAGNVQTRLYTVQTPPELAGSEPEPPPIIH